MDMAGSESGDGMKNSKLQDGESETKNRINKILRQVTKLREKKPATNKRTARINMILDLVNQLKEEESKDDDKLESMKKLEEEQKKLESMMKLEEEKKLELMKKLDEEKKLEEDTKLESMKKLEEEEKKLESVKKLESMKKLEEEDTKLESMKKLEEEETKLEEEKKLKSMKKLEEEKEFEEMLKQVQVDIRNSIIRDFCFCYDAKLTYDRDSTDFCNPEEMLRLKGYAQMAIDVFNKRQPIQYSVEEIDIATTRLVDDGFLVFLLFTAMADAVHQFNGADFFRADIHGGTQLPEVTYVDYSFLYDCM
ncbi:hypothetical protein ACP275_06G080400 [Erythranthe tilingii]